MNAQDRKKRKENIGVVVSDKMDKTVTVKVTRRMKHPKYDKIIERSKKYYAHDATNALLVGQTVRIMATRPLSKLKRWRVVEVL